MYIVPMCFMFLCHVPPDVLWRCVTWEQAGLRVLWPELRPRQDQPWWHLLWGGVQTLTTQPPVLWEEVTTATVYRHW